MAADAIDGSWYGALMNQCRNSYLNIGRLLESNRAYQEPVNRHLCSAPSSFSVQSGSFIHILLFLILSVDPQLSRSKGGRVIAVAIEETASGREAV